MSVSPSYIPASTQTLSSGIQINEDKPILQHYEKFEMSPEDSKRKSYILHEILTAACIYLAVLQIGFNLGFATAAIGELLVEHKLTKFEVSLFGAFLFLGSALGNSAVAILPDLCGRKLSLMIGAVASGIGWWLVIADFHVYVLYAGRLLCGFNYGFTKLLAIIYLTETMSYSMRGTVVAINSIINELSIALCFGLSFILSWRWIAVVSIGIILVFIVAMVWLPESPRWYAKYGHFDEARQSLMWLRMGDTAKVRDEMTAIENPPRARNVEVSIANLISERSFRCPLLVALLIAFAQSLSCYYPMITFFRQILSAYNVTNTTIISFCIALMQVVICGITAALAYRTGRRTFLILGGAIVTVSLLLLSLADILFQGNTYAYPNWLTMVSAFAFMIGSNVGMNTFANLIIYEVLPTPIRSFVAGIVHTIGSIAIFISSFTFNPMLETIYLSGTFFFYCLLNLALTILVALFVPETSNQYLEEVELNFQ